MTRTIILLAALLGYSCEKPPPKDPPRDGPGTCESARNNLEQLGGCGINMQSYVSHCHDREKAEAKFGARSAETCVTNARDCESAFNKCK